MLGGRGGGLLPSGPSCDAKPAKTKKKITFMRKSIFTYNQCKWRRWPKIKLACPFKKKKKSYIYWFTARGTFCWIGTLRCNLSPGVNPAAAHGSLQSALWPTSQSEPGSSWESPDTFPWNQAKATLPGRFRPLEKQWGTWEAAVPAWCSYILSCGVSLDWAAAAASQGTGLKVFILVSSSVEDLPAGSSSLILMSSLMMVPCHLSL